MRPDAGRVTGQTGRVGCPLGGGVSTGRGINRSNTLQRVADETYALPHAMTPSLLAAGYWTS